MRVFSGIKPTGDVTLGNYSGGFRQYAAAQDLGETFFCIVDLHAITVEHEPQVLRRRTLDLAAMLLATGVDPQRSALFVQSHVAEHAQAAWLLSAVTSHGQLGRMTQFKEKGERQRFVSSALFNYPVLMAGDILLYRATHVPIGDDQRQHLELARDIAERFNTTFGALFVVPEGIYPDAGARIMDLQEPGSKMGKTGSSGAGTVRILDDPDAIRAKFKAAVTDSGREIVHDRREKPGISNLIEILHVATAEPIDAIESRYRGVGYGAFKDDVGEAVVALLAPIQWRYAEIRNDERSLRDLLEGGAAAARAAAGPVLHAMYDRMGFLLP